MWARYIEALKTRPIRTNMATAFFINFAGDVLAQNIAHEQGNQTILWERTCTVASYGMLVAAPNYRWFVWLDQQFPLPLLGRSGGKLSFHVLSTLVKRLGVHLFLFGPTVNGCFYGWLILKDRLKEQYQFDSALLSTPQYTYQETARYNQSFWQEWYAKLEKDLLETTKNSCKLWGTAQSFNFLFLPPHTRVLFTNCVLVFWTAYLSVVGHRKEHASKINDVVVEHTSAVKHL